MRPPLFGPTALSRTDDTKILQQNEGGGSTPTRMVMKGMRNEEKIRLIEGNNSDRPHLRGIWRRFSRETGKVCIIKSETQVRKHGN